jgi:hypothetical protein
MDGDTDTWARPLDGPLTTDRIKIAILGGAGDGTAFSEPRLWETEAGIVDLGDLILHAADDPDALRTRLEDMSAYYRDLADAARDATP